MLLLAFAIESIRASRALLLMTLVGIRAVFSGWTHSYQNSPQCVFPVKRSLTFGIIKLVSGSLKKLNTSVFPIALKVQCVKFGNI